MRVKSDYLYRRWLNVGSGATTMGPSICQSSVGTEKINVEGRPRRNDSVPSAESRKRPLEVMRHIKTCLEARQGQLARAPQKYRTFPRSSSETPLRSVRQTHDAPLACRVL